MSKDNIVTSRYQITHVRNGVLRCEILTDLVFTQALAHEIFDTCNQMVECKHGILWIMNKKIIPDSKVMDAFAHPSRCERVKAEAFCLGNPTLMHLANFYVKLKKPAVKSRNFTDEKQATDWLLKECVPLTVKAKTTSLS